MCYNLVQQHHDPNGDITIETPGYKLESDVAFRSVDPSEYIRGRRVTTIPRWRLDAEFSGGMYIEEPLVVDGNLYCCRFKRERSGWMKAFTAELARRASEVPAAAGTDKM